MPTRGQVCTWIATLGLLVPCVAAGQERSEREVVELIVRDGPRARAIRAEPEVTRREQAARLAYPNPSLSYSREGAGFTEFLQAEQSLPLFGPRGAWARAGQAATAAADAAREARLWQLRSEAAATVARVVAAQDRLASARTHLSEVERLLDILRTREREGEGSRFDRLRAEQEHREAGQIVTTAAVALAEGRATVAAMLPRDVAVPTILRDDETRQQAPLDTLLTRASARADLRALRQSSERATAEADAARGARRPSPTLIGGLKRAGDTSARETGGLFGISVMLPVFDAGGREAARWEAERARADAERASREHEIRAGVISASEVLSLRSAALRQEQSAAADELLRIAEVAYREGEVGILELLDAVRTVARAKTRHMDLRLDTRLAEIALEHAVGDVLWP